MRPVPLHDHADLGDDIRTKLEAVVQPLRTLADVLAWARTTVPPSTIVEIITQDEYTHDVTLPLAGARPLWLAYDTT